MNLLTTLLIAVGLAMDCFAVSLGIGTTRVADSPRPIFRLAYHFGFFQFLMTVLGWLVGQTIVTFVATFDHWIALGLLAFVGIRMIIEGMDLKNSEEPVRTDPSKGGTLVILSIATSLDALAVGLSLAMLSVNIWTASLTIGLVSSGFSLIGLLAGQKLGQVFGKRMEVLGGLLLIGIGIRILITHLF